MLTALLGATLGWYARWFARDKPWLVKFAPISLIATVAIVIALTEYAKTARVQLTALPEYPWLEAPTDRKPYTNFAIRPKILVRTQYNDAHVTLLNVYRFTNGKWGNSLNSGLTTPVAWYASNAFDKQTILSGTDTYLAPFVISEPGDALQYQLSPKPQTVEITRWASKPLIPGQYKFVFVLESSNQESLFFDFFLNWYGSPATIDFRIAPHS